MCHRCNSGYIYIYIYVDARQALSLSRTGSPPLSPFFRDPNIAGTKISSDSFLGTLAD